MGAQEMILVVDDEVAVRETTRAILITYNYRVVTAADGREAIQVESTGIVDFGLVCRKYAELLEQRVAAGDGRG